MWTHTAEPAVSPDTGVNVGLLVAAAMAQETFEPSLSARSPVDQGVVTGLSTGLHYLLTLGAQDAIQAVAAEIARKRPARGPQDALARQRAVTFLADLAVVPVGLALRKRLPPRPGEAMARGALRQAGWRLAVTGVGGALLIGSKASLEAWIDASGAGAALRRSRSRCRWGWRRVRPGPPPAREASEPMPGADAPGAPSALRSLAIAGGVVGGLAAAAYGEHLPPRPPGAGSPAGCPAAHSSGSSPDTAFSSALLAAGVSNIWGRGMRKIEAGTDGGRRRSSRPTRAPAGPGPQ